MGDFEVVQRNLVPKHKGLKITLILDTYEQKVWMMRQPTTLNAEDQQLLELTFRRKWEQVNHEYEQAIMEARNSNQRRRKSDAMSKAWRVIMDAFVQSMLIQTAQIPKYVQDKGKTTKFFQAMVGGFTKPGKIGEVALQVRQLQNWANKIARFRDEWKKEERANQQSGRIAEHSRRCDRTRWEMLVTKGHYWLARIGTEMNEQTLEKLVMAAWKETEKEHKNYVAERIKKRNEKLNKANSTNGKYLHQWIRQDYQTACNNEENRRIQHDELPRDSPDTRRGVETGEERSHVTLTSRSALDVSSRTS